jgi:hypothetical protein
MNRQKQWKFNHTNAYSRTRQSRAANASVMSLYKTAEILG